MAGKKPKPPWGRAHSAAFKTLKSEWDRKGTINGVRIKNWPAAFKATGKLARKKADSKHTNPIAAGRIFSTLSKGTKKKSAAKKSNSRTELVVVKIAGGELTNTSKQAATMRKDGSREVVNGNSDGQQ